MTNVESTDYTQSHASTIASLFGTLHCPFSPWELVQTSPVHPNPVIRYALSHINLFISSSKQPPYLPIMAFPKPFRDILPCNFPPFRLSWHASSLSYCFAWSCSWHRICGKATVHNCFIHVTLDSLHILVHRWRHSHRVIFCSKYWVVNVEL